MDWTHHEGDFPEPLSSLCPAVYLRGQLSQLHSSSAYTGGDVALLCSPGEGGRVGGSEGRWEGGWEGGKEEGREGRRGGGCEGGRVEGRTEGVRE